ncbi:hypothetical protein CC80DRAFT_541629 [Byssothecium circinans]|uniref:Uncharacterized protein n=1 Tax=Byssothecium circinans TaxID=147558 RepID=A0A6A5UES5_9PLEO|nr:hypothetical protein CC80DRAFT_541629 [Byssothecium circinans]
MLAFIAAAIMCITAIAARSLPSSLGNIRDASFNPSASGHGLIKRWKTPLPADDEVWDKAVCEGRNLLTEMKGSDVEAGATYHPPKDSAVSEFENFPRDSIQGIMFSRVANDSVQRRSSNDYYWNPPRD